MQPSPHPHSSPSPRLGRRQASTQQASTWQNRYRRALRNCNFAFAALAFLLPLILMGLIYFLDRVGICAPQLADDRSSHCSIAGVEFGEYLDALLLPTALGIVTLFCLVMSGTGTFLYLVWGVQKK